MNHNSDKINNESNNKVPHNNSNPGAAQTDNGKEGDSMIRWLLYLWKYRVIAVISFLLFFAAGASYTFLSPKYYESKSTFFFPLSSAGGGLLDSLGLSGLLDASGGLSNYAVSILESETVSNHIIDKFGKRLFGDEMKKPRSELLKKLPWMVKITLTPSQVIEVSVETKDPKLSAEIANYYIKEYRLYSVSSNLTIAKQHREKMEEQRDGVKKELNKLENQLLVFQNKEKVIDPPAELQAMLQYYANIKAMSVVAEVTDSQNKSRLSALRDKMTQQAEKSDSNPEYAQLLGNSSISALYQQLTAKEMELAKQLQTKTEENPAVAGLQDDISDLRRLMKEKVKAHLTGVRSDLTPVLIDAYAETLAQGAKNQALQKVIKDLDAKMEEIPDVAYSYRRIYRDILIKEKLLGYLELEVEKARSEEFRNPNEIQILDKAIPPDMYSRPILRWYLLGTIFLSFIMMLLSVKMADIFCEFRKAVIENN